MHSHDLEPLTQGDLIFFAIALPCWVLLLHYGRLAIFRMLEKEQCRANHPAGKGLPRK